MHNVAVWLIPMYRTQTSIAKKPYIFVIFQGGGGYGPPAPPLSGFAHGHQLMDLRIWFSNHLAEDERAGCFTLIVFFLLGVCLCSVSLPRVAFTLVVAFLGHTHLFLGFIIVILVNTVGYQRHTQEINSVGWLITSSSFSKIRLLCLALCFRRSIVTRRF